MARVPIPRAGALAVAFALLLAGALSPAAVAAAGPIPESVNGVPFERYIQAHNHALGSQIRRVEGDDSTVRTKAQAMRSKQTGRGGAARTVPGIDVSSHQGDVDWQRWWAEGKRFAYVKATEGTYYTNPYHDGQSAGAHAVGMIRGSYHFAIPNGSSGAAQANYFVDNGGGWAPGGRTLPGALDLEYNPYGDTCYGLSEEEMAAWIRDFSDTYRDRTGRYPVIYTSTSWWSQCVGVDFSATNPLWVARYAAAPGRMPYDWSYHTFWQYTSTPIDQNAFNGSYDQLVLLATG